MDLVYLDYNCFQRGFDDPTQIRIQLEALACQEIFINAEANKIELVWSFMHEDETLLCPILERKHEAFRLADICKVRIEPEEEIRKLAHSFQKRSKISAKDALHVACACFIKADFFLTCDDKLMKQAKRLKIQPVPINPVEYIRQGGS